MSHTEWYFIGEGCFNQVYRSEDSVLRVPKSRLFEKMTPSEFERLTSLVLESTDPEILLLKPIFETLSRGGSDYKEISLSWYHFKVLERLLGEAEALKSKLQFYPANPTAINNPKRFVRVLNEVSPELKAKETDGISEVEFVDRDPCLPSDIAITLKMFDIYHRTGRVLADPTSEGNILWRKGTEEYICVDAELALKRVNSEASDLYMLNLSGVSDVPSPEEIRRNYLMFIQKFYSAYPEHMHLYPLSFFCLYKLIEHELVLGELEKEHSLEERQIIMNQILAKALSLNVGQISNPVQIISFLDFKNLARLLGYFDSEIDLQALGTDEGIKLVRTSLSHHVCSWAEAYLSNSDGDIAWKEFEELLQFKEVEFFIRDWFQQKFTRPRSIEELDKILDLNLKFLGFETENKTRDWIKTELIELFLSPDFYDPTNLYVLTQYRFIATVLGMDSHIPSDEELEKQTLKEILQKLFLAERDDSCIRELQRRLPVGLSHAYWDALKTEVETYLQRQPSLEALKKAWRAVESRLMTVVYINSTRSVQLAHAFVKAEARFSPPASEGYACVLFRGINPSSSGSFDSEESAGLDLDPSVSVSPSPSF